MIEKLFSALDVQRVMLRSMYDNSCIAYALYVARGRGYRLTHFRIIIWLLDILEFNSKYVCALQREKNIK